MVQDRTKTLIFRSTMLNDKILSHRTKQFGTTYMVADYSITPKFEITLIPLDLMTHPKRDNFFSIITFEMVEKLLFKFAMTFPSLRILFSHQFL